MASPAEDQLLRKYFQQGLSYIEIQMLMYLNHGIELRNTTMCALRILDPEGVSLRFSRRILWLRVARTNNNPKVVASYFLDYVEEIAGVPRCIRIDAGTENGHIEDMQKAFRWNDDDAMAGDKSVIIGSSTSNQEVDVRLVQKCILPYGMPKQMVS
uniref:Uncharacterized protein n=1 Tax=Magallana gigas TaxID=29159 RepID=K1QD53_MAGGI